MLRKLEKETENVNLRWKSVSLMNGVSCTGLCNRCSVWTISTTPHLVIKKGSGQESISLESPETFLEPAKLFMFDRYLYFISLKHFA